MLSNMPLTILNTAWISIKVKIKKKNSSRQSPKWNPEIKAEDQTDWRNLLNWMKFSFQFSDPSVYLLGMRHLKGTWTSIPHKSQTPLFYALCKGKQEINLSWLPRKLSILYFSIEKKGRKYPLNSCSYKLVFKQVGGLDSSYLSIWKNLNLKI